MTSIDLSPTASDVAQAVRDRALAWVNRNQDADDPQQGEIIADLMIDVTGETQILVRVLDTEEGIDCMDIAQGILASANADLRLGGRIQRTAPCEYRLEWD